jgi:hypothetical protein
MKGLERRIWRLRDERHQAAVLGCRFSDAFRDARSPEVLDNFQHALRMGLLDIEARLRSWQERSLRRPRKIKALRKRAGGGSALIGEHIQLAKAHEEDLGAFREMLRQFGDSIAWAVLSYNPRLIYPLFGFRTHHLNTGVGITAVAHVIIEAHKSGEFLVIDNDLTRCLGIGDITVVRADSRRGGLPLPLELKARLHGSQLVEGSEVSVNFVGALLTNSAQAQLHADFVAALHLNVGLSDDAPATRSPQLTEMTARAEWLIQMVSEPRAGLNAKREHWRSLRNVLDRALQTGGAYDSPEPGIAHMAVRLSKGDDSASTMVNLMHRMQSEGFPRGHSSLTLGEFTTDDKLSTIAPPIAIWPLPLAQRAALLSGRVFLACAFTSSLWDDALRREGLSIERRPDQWLVRGGHRVLQLDNLEVLKLRVGVAFGGISPQDAASGLRRTADGAI